MVGERLGRRHLLPAACRLLCSRGINALNIAPLWPLRTHARDARSLIDRLRMFVPLPQVQALLEVTGHAHRAWLQYLQEVDIPVFVIQVQKRQEGWLTSDKRDALGLANRLYHQREKGIHVGDPLQAVRRLLPLTPAAASLRGMVRHPYELVAESTECKNTLTARCDELFASIYPPLAQPPSADSTGPARAVSHPDCFGRCHVLGIASGKRTNL